MHLAISLECDVDIYCFFRLTFCCCRFCNFILGFFPQFFFLLKWISLTYSAEARRKPPGATVKTRPNNHNNHNNNNNLQKEISCLWPKTIIQLTMLLDKQ